MKVKIATSTIKDGNMKEEKYEYNIKKFLSKNKFNAEKTTFMIQTHSNNIRKITAKNKIQQINNTDAIYTFDKNIPLVVYTADCVPIVLYDHNKIAVVHAGYRGIENGIIEKIVTKFEVKRTFSWIGPSICYKCYDVDASRADRFKKLHSDSVIKLNSKNHLDLKKIVINKLIYSKIQDFYVSPDCTKCSGNYHSFRSGNKGSNITVAQIQ